MEEEKKKKKRSRREADQWKEEQRRQAVLLAAFCRFYRLSRSACSCSQPADDDLPGCWLTEG